VNKTFSIAPMLDLTDRHCRAFFRLFSGNIRLYTEMIVVGSIIHGDRDRFLGFDTSEHPLALQLGGCDPGKLGICAQLAEERGYDEVNLNIGCPSDRVKSARFGACLMARPQLVADCVSEMIRSVAIPVTVKTRIGIDDQDSYEYLAEFIETVSAAGCKHFIVHARKAWLTGLSPKENRTVPPLHYDRVYKLKEDFPGVAFTLNGGITSIEQIETHLPKVDGVMIGREAYRNPWILKQMDDHFFKNDNSESPGENKIITRHEIVEAYLPYIEKQLSQGVYLRHMTRHMLGLFQGQGGAKGWRRHLSEYGPRKNAGIEVIQEALKFVDHDRKQAEYGDRVAYG
jgi:tRNA-dihydrouridine synthase A